MTFTIDKGIPVPHYSGVGNPHGRPREYPFDQMEVGDSFFAPRGEKTRYWLWALADQFGKDHGGKFRVAAWEQGGVVGARCWRIK